MSAPTFDFVLDRDAWLDAADASGVFAYEPAGRVIAALCCEMDQAGSATAASVVSHLELADPITGEHDPEPASATYADGVHALEAAHLLHDFGARIVAIRPTIFVAPQEV